MVHRGQKSKTSRGVATVPKHAARDVNIAGIRANSPEDRDLVASLAQGVESADGQGLCNNFELEAHGVLRGLILASAKAAMENGQPLDKVDYAEIAYGRSDCVRVIHELGRAQILGKTTPLVDVPVYRGSLQLVEAIKTVYRQLRRAFTAEERKGVTFPKAITLRMVGKRPHKFSGPEISEAEALVKIELASEQEVAGLEARAEAVKADAKAKREAVEAASGS